MRYLSVCSGIEAASVAWHPLGWKAAAFSEIEPFPCAVLAYHYPGTPNLGDMNGYKEWPIEHGAIDLLVGGTPCQSFSVAGLRKGLDDPRGNLMLVYLAIARRFAPRWVVWENVPGVLSSSGGRDFGTFLRGLAECGYGFAYRVLDAQFFGVPQRRRRVFVVGHLGDWRVAAAVLFERESLRRYPPPSREAGERVADPLTVGANQYSGFNGEPVEQVAYAVNAHGGSGRMDGESETFIAGTLPADYGKQGGNGMGSMENGMIAHSLRAEHDASEDGTGRGTPLVFDWQTGFGINPSETVPTQQAGSRSGGIAMLSQTGVRRLTPRECERLQGFPDDYTAIPYRGKPAADGPRYKALGNSMARPVMTWLGVRIDAVEVAA